MGAGTLGVQLLETCCHRVLGLFCSGDGAWNFPKHAALHFFIVEPSQDPWNIAATRRPH